MDAAYNLYQQPVEQVRARWECRAIRMATLFAVGLHRPAVPRDKIGMCVLSIVASRLPIEELQYLLRICGFRGTAAPMLTSAAKIAKTGHVMANLLARDQNEYQNQQLFKDTRHMAGAMRRFADTLGLSDAERVEFFDAVKAWVVCDYRLDPTMDRADPDAKRMTPGVTTLADPKAVTVH